MYSWSGGYNEETALGACNADCAENPYYAHLPIPDKRFDVKRIDRSRNLSAFDI